MQTAEIRFFQKFKDCTFTKKLEIKQQTILNKQNKINLNLNKESLFDLIDTLLRNFKTCCIIQTFSIYF